MTEELPLNKYLSLAANNVVTQNKLNQLVNDGNVTIFKSIASSILSITLQESDALYQQVLQLNSASNSSSISTVESKANTITNSLEPDITISPSINIHTKDTDAFAIIMDSDKYIQQRMNNNNNFEQHQVLKKIFPIPSSTKNVQQATFDKIDAIKEMQAQYKTNRLSEIPEATLKSEFVLRTNIIDTIRTIKINFDKITKHIEKEISDNVHLHLLLSRNKKNRQKTYNLGSLQHELYTLILHAEGLLSSINQIIIQSEQLVIDRQLIFKMNGEYHAKINQWRQQVTDSTVTNYFLTNFNKWKATSSQISTLLDQFRIHIQQNKYTMYIGSLKDIENGWKQREKENKERREMYQHCKAIQSQFKQCKLSDNLLEKQLKINGNDINKTIKSLIESKHIGDQNEEEIQNISKIIVDTIKEKETQKSKTKKTKTKTPKRKKKVNQEKGLQTLTNFWGNKKRSFQSMQQSHDLQQPLVKKQRLKE